MHIQFAELPVSDQDRAIAFYVTHLGLTVVSDEPMGDGWRWVELGFPSERSNLHFVRRKDGVPSEEPVLVLVDEDVPGTVARLKSSGVEIVNEPQEFPWQPGRLVAEFRDSEGNRMMLGSP
jgi:predicted enzyme related to lactoylglutathione lyase